MRKISFLLLVVSFFNSCIQHVNEDSNSPKADEIPKNENHWPKEDEFYSIFYTTDLIPELKNIRPLKSDSTIQFCIPVAFTKLENDSIDGLFIVEGKIINRSNVNHHLGGGMMIYKIGRAHV